MFNISFKAIIFPFISECSGIIILERIGRADRACCSDTSSCELCLLLSPAGTHKATSAEQKITASAKSSCRQMWRAQMRYVNMMRAFNRAGLLLLPLLVKTRWFSINPAFPKVWQGTQHSLLEVWGANICMRAQQHRNPPLLNNILTQNNYCLSKVQPNASPQPHLSSKTPGLPSLFLVSHKLQELKVLEMLRLC